MSDLNKNDLNKNHLSEEQIILHYYGDAEDATAVEQHLAGCAECRTEFSRVQAMLKQIEPIEVPEPPAVFEEKVWLNLRDQLPAKGSFLKRLFGTQQKWALAGAMALLLVGAFMAGRISHRTPDNTIAGQNGGQTNPANPERIVLVAVGNHLERSQMLLLEIMHSDGTDKNDFSSEQQLARDLLDDNHLYRLSSMKAGDPQVTHVLDQLGRVLAEIANGPSEVSASDLQQMRHTIQSEGLLFKVRVIESEVNSKVRQPEELSGRNANQRL